MKKYILRALVIFCSVFPDALAQQPPAWSDKSPHKVRFVTVDKDVQLEVLDWGGTGRAVVLLAGSGNSAHVFDDFAPKLSDCCHVYGITRRGYGASSQPASGYDNQRLSDDVVRVLDELQIERPVLAGHSAAGGELTTIGNQHSDRLSGLVYLDALGDGRDWPASDPAYMALLRKLPPGAPPPPCPHDGTPAGSWTALQCRTKLPASELHNVFTTNGDGSAGEHKTPGWIHRAMGDGDIKRDYSRIRVPVLAFYEFPRTSLDQLRADEPKPRNDEEAKALITFALAHKAFLDRWTANLKRGVPTARIVDLPAAGHFVFLTKEADVLREMRAFIASTR